MGDYADAKQRDWLERHGRAESGLPINPATGLEEQRPGQVYLAPYNQWGAPAGWIDAQEYEDRYNTGWTPMQMFAMALPWALGGASALIGGAGGAASGGIPSIGVTSGIPAGVSVGTPVAGFGAASGGTAAAGSAGTGVATTGGGMAGLGWRDALQLAPSIYSMFKQPASGGELPYSRELESLLGLQRQRMEQAQPLYDAVLRLAMSLAPISARGPLGGAPLGGGAAMPPRPTATTRAR